MFLTLTQTHQNRTQAHQKGLSLIELMISLLLSSLLILGILTLYFDSSQTSRVSQSLARVQESGRIALDLIAKDLRMTGFVGCADPLQELSPAFDATTLDEAFYQSSLRGARVDGSSWADMEANAGVAVMNIAAVETSDVLQVRRASGSSVTLESDMAATASVLDTDSDEAVTRFRFGGTAIITNCVTADVFTVGDPSGLDDDKINHLPFSIPYPEGSRVLPFVTAVYWVGNTGRNDQRGNTIWALYQNGLEVVAGVERLQLLYGVRDAADNLRYETADDLSAAEWNDIEVVQLGLLVSDEQSVLEVADTKSYDLPDLSVQPAGTVGAVATYPADGRLRTTFTMTVNLRNNIDS